MGSCAWSCVPTGIAQRSVCLQRCAYLYVVTGVWRRKSPAKGLGKARERQALRFGELGGAVYSTRFLQGRRSFEMWKASSGAACKGVLVSMADQRAIACAVFSCLLAKLRAVLKLVLGFIL